MSSSVLWANFYVSAFRVISLCLLLPSKTLKTLTILFTQWGELALFSTVSTRQRLIHFKRYARLSAISFARDIWRMYYWKGFQTFKIAFKNKWGRLAFVASCWRRLVDIRFAGKCFPLSVSFLWDQIKYSSCDFQTYFQLCDKVAHDSKN